MALENKKISAEVTSTLPLDSNSYLPIIQGATPVNYKITAQALVDGVTGVVRTTGASQTISGNVTVAGNFTATGTNTLSSATTIGNVSPTELDYLNGVSSSIQTQLNGKALSSEFNSSYASTTGILVPSTTSTYLMQVTNENGPDDNTVTFGNDLYDTAITGASVYISNIGSLRLKAMQVAPATATSTGTVGMIRITATHIYVCTATNTWVRTGLLTTW